MLSETLAGARSGSERGVGSARRARAPETCQLPGLRVPGVNEPGLVGKDHRLDAVASRGRATSRPVRKSLGICGRLAGGELLGGPRGKEQSHVRQVDAAGIARDARTATWLASASSGPSARSSTRNAWCLPVRVLRALRPSVDETPRGQALPLARVPTRGRSGRVGVAGPDRRARAGGYASSAGSREFLCAGRLDDAKQTDEGTLWWYGPTSTLGGEKHVSGR